MNRKIPSLEKFIYDNELTIKSAWFHLMTLVRNKRNWDFWETRNWYAAYESIEGNIDDDICEFEYGYLSGMIYAALVIYWPEWKSAIKEVLEKIR